MFAHQVIEDMDRIGVNSIDGIKKYLSIICLYIKNSIKFHAGDVDSMYSLCYKDVGEKLFTDNKYLKLPYDIMWIDYTNRNASNKRCQDYSDIGIDEYNKPLKNTKEAILVVNEGGGTWMATCFSYLQEGKSWFPSYCTFTIYINNTRENMAINLLRGVNYPYDRKRTIEMMRREYQMNLFLLQSFVKILNCKNIGTEDHRAPSDLNMARKRRGRQELFTYKTLKLLLPGKKEKHLLQNNPTGDHNRIHFCRGHFKEYTAEAPLFGRITGLWWWQPHVRGKSTDGVVMKDYQVEVAP